MSSSVQALIKATAKSPNKPSNRCSPNEVGREAFQAELGRASKRGEKAPAESDDAPKAEKSSRQRKCEQNSQSRKADGGEAAPAEEAAQGASPETDPADADAAPADGEASDADVQQVVDLSDKETAEEDPSLLAMEAAVPVVPPPITAAAEGEETPVTATPVVTQAQTGDTADARPGDQATVPLPEGMAPADEPGESEAAAKPGANQPSEPGEPAPAQAAPESAAAEETPAAPLKKDAEAPAPSTPEATAPKAVPVPATPKPAAPVPPPEVRFAEANHTDIVRGIRTELLPRGGTMQIRLDPPELGALNVILSIKDGIATASFQTNNEEATKLLSHSLSQLKTALESTGVTVDKLQVQQSPKNQETGDNKNDSQQRGQPGQDDMSRQQEQQRKEMLRRMWRRLNIGSDPLDLVA